MAGDSSHDETRWRRLPLVLGQLPGDMIAVAVFGVIAEGILTMQILGPSILGVLVGLPLLFFVPGYALVAVVVPRGGSGSFDHGTDRLDVDHGGQNGIDLFERLALSLGMSVALIPPVALLASVAGLALETVPLVFAGIAIFGAVGGTIRRLRLPPQERFRLPVRRWREEFSGGFLEGSTRTRILNIALLASLVFAAGAVTYPFVVPNDGGSSSTLYLATQDDDGDLVAADFPSNLTRGETASLVVGLTSAESEQATYTVLAQLQRVRTEDGSVQVLDREELARFQPTLQPGERWVEDHEIRPTLPGENLRLQYRLYRGTISADRDAESPYRTAHLWLNVSES